jgi:predicted transposase YbfD/YdcC
MGADAPQPVRAALGARQQAPGHCSVPAEATIRRTLSRLDADVLAGAIGAWPAPSAPGWPPGTGTVAAGGGRAVAVDGKTLRGARAADGRPVHLLACMDHASRTVLAQRQVGGAPEEVPVFQPLLDGLDLAGAVITADALQTRPQAAEFLVTRMHAHYLFTVKANQPTLLDRCQRLPWHRVPVLDCTRDRGHGRIELRTLKAVTVGHFGFPRAAQVLQVTRKTRGLHTKRWRTVIVYVITSLPFEQASPARLTDLLRGHWTIENGLHWVRDVTFAEDGSQLRAGTARRSWPACATWSSAPSAAPGRSTSPPPCATTPATHSDPSRPLGLPSGEPGATQERPERWVLGDRWWEQRCRRPWWCRYSSAMKAAVHTSYGPPEVVRITEVDKPTPKDNEVLVKVRATTVNRTDCALRAAKPLSIGSSPGCSDHG